MENTLKLKNKIAIITGAGKGIGKETAILFAKLGCRLALISRTAEDLNELSKELNMDKNDLLIVEGDVSLEKIVLNFVSQVHKKFGRIDILVNNAGMRFRKSFLEISYQEWQEVMNVNAGSTFLFCREVGKYMKEQQYGKIINMASVIGTLGLPELTGYGASKGAILSLTKSLALEWAEDNININVIAPGFCKTSYSDNFKKKSDLYDFTIERTPMKKWGESIDIANTIAFLSSDMSKYITGETISIDGGWSAW